MGRPFDGLHVVEFGVAIVGPVTGLYLAQYGATTVHVETETKLDIFRLGPPFKEGKPGINRSLLFNEVENSKYGVSLNLRHPKALDVARKLIAWADVVIENFAAGALEHLGLGYKEIQAIKPDIIMCSASAQGQNGPHARQPFYGPDLAALCGFNEICGWPDRPPSPIHGAYTDFLAPRLAAATIIAALDRRKRTGEGMFIDISQFEVSIQFIAPVVLDSIINDREVTRTGNRVPDAAPQGVYPCKGEDRWCAITIVSDDEWRRFCQAIGGPAWAGMPQFATFAGRKEHEDELDSLIAGWTKDLAAEEVMRILQGVGVRAGIARNSQETMSDPQMRSRDAFVPLHHAELGEHECESLFFKLSRTPGGPRFASFCLGEYNAYIYKDVLGLSDKEYRELEAEGVFK